MLYQEQRPKYCVFSLLSLLVLVGVFVVVDPCWAAPESIVVCEDAGCGAYEAFPDVCRLKDGRLMCVFYAGWGHISLPNKQLPNGGRISYCTSDDEGRTWSAAKTLFDGPLDDRDPSLTQLSDGRLMCVFFKYCREGGKIMVSTWIVTSKDAGKTWSKAVHIPGPYGISSPIRELSDGRLILSVYGPTKSGPTKKYTGYIATSDDGGKTWSKFSKIDNGKYNLPAETDVIELKDGSLFAALRGRNNDMCWSKSSDRGTTWTTAKPFGFPGHCPYLHRTVDGIIVMAQRLPKTAMRYSLDECKTWSEVIEVDTFGGAYPSMVNLKDGSVLIVYYEEGKGSNIRAKRFRVDRNGVKWLPPCEVK